MLRIVARSSPRAIRPIQIAARRSLFTAPAQKRYTWKGTVARWGTAAAAFYWYNTSPIFADEIDSEQSPVPAAFADADSPTIDAIVEEKRRQLDEAQAKRTSSAAKTPPKTSQSAATDAIPPTADAGAASSSGDGPSPEALEEEAGNQGAFNEETGEINWDCPCLGGMAHGPCGEEFRTAFSCFVYSKEEPKGMECIDHFQHMQDCFRKHPDIYGAEIDDDEEDKEGVEADSPAPSAEGHRPAAGKQTQTEQTQSRSGAPTSKPPKDQERTGEEVKASKSAKKAVDSSGESVKSEPSGPGAKSSADTPKTEPLQKAMPAANENNDDVPADVRTVSHDATAANDNIGK